MDLNLYLGLPRSRLHRGSDLGSDLSLGSINLSAEEAHMASEMTDFVDPSAADDPYSPTHASFTPTTRAIESLERAPQFDFSQYPPSPPSLQLPGESLAQDERSGQEYSPYSPSYIPVSSAEETEVEPLDDSTNYAVHHAPYSPSYVQVNAEPVVEERSTNNHVEYEPYSPYYSPLPQPVRLAGLEERYARDVGMHAPYSPVYVPLDSTEPVRDDNPTGQSSSAAVFGASYEHTGQGTMQAIRDSDSERELLQYPEFRFRRLIESHRRWPVRSFRPAAIHASNPGNAASLSPRQILELVTSEGSAEASAVHKVNLAEQAGGDMEEETKEGNSVANFECNICLDMAKEPVVTSCGHLFCWPCLYQWLHLHSNHKECPVCKGEVTESNIIPIYGRGSSESDGEKKGDCQDGNPSMKVPPRPRGCRFESLRQRFRRPLSRTWFGDDFSSLRRFVDEELRTRATPDGPDGRNNPGMLDGGSRRVLTRLRAFQRLQRGQSSEHGFMGTGNATSRNSPDLMPSPQIRNTMHETPGAPLGTSVLNDGIDFWHRISLYSLPTSERIAALTAGLSTVVERIMTVGGSHSGGSAPPNPPESEPSRRQAPPGTPMAADQASASASSTMAEIQGDVAVSTSSLEPNDAGTSRSIRRRRRNGGMGSLDVDGGHPARKRRRLN